MPIERPPSKAAIRNAEIAARRAARIQRAADEKARLDAARDAARALLQRMPTEFQEWGVTRTRAYLRLLEIVGSKVDNVTLKPATLEGYLQVMRDASEWSLPYCVRLSSLHARAASVSMADEGVQS